MSRRAFTVEYKYEIIKAWEDGTYSLNELAKKYKVSISSILDWKYKYDIDGTEGLKKSSTWKTYTNELKLNAVNDYLSGNYSLREVTRKYGLSDKSVLRKWINKYNSHRDLKDTSKGRTNSMTKGRKTTVDERIQIVLDCLGNGKDFRRTAETFKVSYQQVYQWVKKYEIIGDEALKDGRGRKKEAAELTPEDNFKLQLKKLESEIRFEDTYLAIQELHEKEDFSIIMLCKIARI
ncbi:helix-turn-helix domain-containing protein [Bacillus sinesaloumensis]|uniref:helix-turn-helix domain-containing protein n=1 Tax=Litchfieldia sinesaloumensis TaxID=1926280 RepID=UPI00098888D6|nr:helix-turn-helix domain-containing protein [Bacillus sinesaloumensis]